MIMAKCCHDLDLIQYFIGSKCRGVSSMGSLAYFCKENKPEGAAERCTECKYERTCPYSAERIYVDMWKNEFGAPENAWPMNVITDELPLTAVNTFMACWNDFTTPLMYIDSTASEHFTLAVGIYYRFPGALTNREKAPNVQMALCILMMIPSLIVFAFFQRSLIEGVSLTGLKG